REHVESQRGCCQHRPDRVRAVQHRVDGACLQLALVPVDGSTIGNTALMRTLHWAERRYWPWPVRDSLMEAGTITRAKGRGGAVRRVHSAEAARAAGGR